MNNFLKRWGDFFKFEFPYLQLVIVSLCVAAVWKGNSAAAVTVGVVAVLAYNSAAIAQLLEPFKPKPNPADDAKMQAVVAALNKAHANDKKFDEELQALKGEIGKVNLRFAIKPVNHNDD